MTRFCWLGIVLLGCVLTTGPASAQDCLTFSPTLPCGPARQALKGVDFRSDQSRPQPAPVRPPVHVHAAPTVVVQAPQAPIDCAMVKTPPAHFHSAMPIGPPDPNIKQHLRVVTVASCKNKK